MVSGHGNMFLFHINFAFTGQHFPDDNVYFYLSLIFLTFPGQPHKDTFTFGKLLLSTGCEYFLKHWKYQTSVYVNMVKNLIRKLNRSNPQPL